MARFKKYKLTYYTSWSARLQDVIIKAKSEKSAEMLFRKSFLKEHSPMTLYFPIVPSIKEINEKQTNTRTDN